MSLLQRIRKAIEEEHSQPVQKGIIIHTTLEGMAYWKKVIQDAHDVKNKKGS